MRQQSGYDLYNIDFVPKQKKKPIAFFSLPNERLVNEELIQINFLFFVDSNGPHCVCVCSGLMIVPRGQ